VPLKLSVSIEAPGLLTSLNLKRHYLERPLLGIFILAAMLRADELPLVTNLSVQLQMGRESSLLGDHA